jgi:archaellum biogenesis ATPase FlaH
MQLSKNQLDTALKAIGVKPSDEIQDETGITLEEIDSFGSKESVTDMVVKIQKYNRMLDQKLTFINESVTAAIPFTRENLYLICAYTGSGKSTAAANISYPLWKQEKKVLVISNEEPEQDVLFRIACLDLGVNFNDYKKGLMPRETQVQIMRMFEDIAKYVKVVDVSRNNGFTSKVECIKNTLEAVKSSDYCCVLIDYFQNIKYSAKNKHASTYDNLVDLKAFLNIYIKSANVPIVLFAQLYSQSKRSSKAQDIDARIKDCSSIVEPATVIIEMIPNFEDQTTQFCIHKDRFGFAGNKIICPFEKGRFLRAVSDRELAERKLDQLLGGDKNAQGQPVVSNLQPSQQDPVLAPKHGNQ